MCSMPNDSSREPLDDDDSVEIEVVELVDDRGEKEERLMAHLDAQANQLADDED